MANPQILMTTFQEDADTYLKKCEVAARSWDGILIFTEKEEIHFLISNSISCCESWGFDVNGCEKSIDATTLDLLFQNNISKVNWNHYREKRHNYQDVDPESHHACVDLFIGEPSALIPIPLNVFCRHNGYYAHDISTCWHNHKDSQSL